MARLGGASTVRTALVRAELAAGQPEDALKTIDDAMAPLAIKTEWMLRKADVLESMGRQTDAHRLQPHPPCAASTRS